MCCSVYIDNRLGPLDIFLMAEVLGTKPVYFHDCPALGKNTKIIEATMLSSDNTIVLKRQNKCPFCSATAGEIRYASGVTPNPDGSYTVNMALAERVQ